MTNVRIGVGKLICRWHVCKDMENWPPGIAGAAAASAAENGNFEDQTAATLALHISCNLRPKQELWTF